MINYKYYTINKDFPIIEVYNKNTNMYYISWIIEKRIVKTLIGTEENPSISDILEFLVTKLAFKGNLDIQSIKNLILEDINSSIDSKILEGYTWKDYLVWLSLENLFNYKAAYDIATQSNGTIGLPVTFKFTDPTTQNPVYYTFTTLEELQDFYLGAVNHINKTLEEGWRLKDTFDFSPYEEWLLAHDNSN